MTNQEKKQLAIAACQIRMGIIESTHGAKAGHPGGKPFRGGDVRLSV